MPRTAPTTTRTATHAIEGFLYQFNKTLLAILESTDQAEITVEGLVEDIDIKEPLTTTAIQCKYHESQTGFKLSLIYKPLLQMMEHFHLNKNELIDYRLFVHFPNTEAIPEITKEEIDEILSTTNKDLVSYTSALKNKVDVVKFLEHFSMELGPPLNVLEENICQKFKSFGFTAEDIHHIVYPNAFHFVAQLSIKHDAAKRKTSKPVLLIFLENVKKTTISRWTLALKTAKKILETRKKQLQPNLAKNVRRRSILLSETAASDFNSGLVVFISEYLDQYHSKVAHTETPLFCIDCDQATFDDIRERIHQKGIRYNDGYIGQRFDSIHFARAPVVRSTRAESIREFAIRLVRYDTDPNVLNAPKCDDLFLISAKEYPNLDLKDINEERLCTTTLQQAKFLLGVNHVHE